MARQPNVFDRSGAALPRPRFAALGSDQGGAVAVMLALSLAVLVGMMALAIDLGRLWNLETQLEHAADAGALLGATQLDGSDGARVRAIRAISGEIARNRQSFASDGLGPDVRFDGNTSIAAGSGKAGNRDMKFYARLPVSPAHEATSDTEARFVEVSVFPRRIDLAFAATVGAMSSARPRARSVAGWETFLCGSAPLLMCNPDEPPGNRDLDYPFHVDRHLGAGLTLREGSGAAVLSPGDFAWLAVVACDQTGSCATEKGPESLQDSLARVDPPPACLGTNVEPRAGTMAEAGTFLNMRVDIYPRAGQVDYADDPDYQPSPISLTGLIRDLGVVDPEACNFDIAGGGGAGSSALTRPAQPFLGPDRHIQDPEGGGFVPPIQHMGYPRDNCAYPRDDPATGGLTAPSPINCVFVPPPNSGLAQGDQIGDGIWDLGTYMAYHHPANFVNTPSHNICPAGGCEIGGDVAVDLDGNGKLGRWEIYRWELRDPANKPNNGRPPCFRAGGGALPLSPPVAPNTPDRRLLGVLVGNCAALADAERASGANRAKLLPLAGANPAVRLFLSEAAGEGDPGVLYAEIVGPWSEIGASGVVVQNRVVLYE